MLHTKLGVSMGSYTVIQRSVVIAGFTADPVPAVLGSLANHISVVTTFGLTIQIVKHIVYKQVLVCVLTNSANTNRS